MTYIDDVFGYGRAQETDRSVRFFTRAAFMRSDS